MSDTSVTLMGNLTRDPELRYTPSGSAICQLGMAVNKRWQDRNTNEWKEDTSFFNVAVWAELGENVAESFAKGDRIIVVGTLEQRSWENDEGEKRSVVEVKATDVGGSARWATVRCQRTAKRGDRAPHPADTAEQSAEPAMAGAGTEEF